MIHIILTLYPIMVFSIITIFNMTVIFHVNQIIDMIIRILINNDLKIIFIICITVYLYALKKLTNIVELSLYFLVTIIFLLFIDANAIDMKIMMGYAVLIIPIWFMIITFVLNIESRKILNKSFSYYYSKHINNFGIIMLPFILLVTSLIRSSNSIVFEYLLLLNNIFYTFLIIQIIRDVVRWNKGILDDKYREVYQQAIIDLPFEEAYDRKLYFEFERVKSNIISKSENEESNQNVELKCKNTFLDKIKNKLSKRGKQYFDYEQAYKERIRRLSTLRRYESEIELDNFTFELIKLSIDEQGKKSIELSNKREFNINKSFFEKSDKLFLNNLLLIKDFEFNGISGKETLGLILMEYFKKLDVQDQIIFEMFKERIEEQRRDLEEISPEFYIALYLTGKISILLENINKYNRFRIYNLKDIIILESIVRTHNNIITDNPDANSLSGLKKKLEIKGFKSFEVKKMKKDYEIDNIKTYEDLNEIFQYYEQMFNKVSDKILYSFTFNGGLGFSSLYSEVLLVYMVYMYDKKIRELEDNELLGNEDLIDYLNYLLPLFSKIYRYSKDEERKGKLNKLLVRYADILFEGEKLFKSVPYLVENFNVINDILNDKIRGKIQSIFKVEGRYAIPFIGEINLQMEKEKKIKLLEEFYNKYINQINNEKVYFEFKDEYVKNNRSHKVNVYKEFINVLYLECEFKNQKFKYEFKDIFDKKYFLQAYGIMVVYNDKLEEYVDINNKYVLQGIQMTLNDLKNNPRYGVDVNKNLKSDIEVNVSVKVEKFKKYFKNKKVCEELDIDSSRCVKFLEDIDIPYTINNFDKKAEEQFLIFPSLFVAEMKDPIKFLQDYVKSDFYMGKEKVDFYLVEDIYIFLKSLEGDNQKEIEDLIIEMIDVISKRNVRNNKYNVLRIDEYDVIKRLNEEFIMYPKISGIFTSKVIVNIEPYLLN